MPPRSKKEQRQKRVVSARKRIDEHKSGLSLTSIRIPEGMQLFQIKKAGTYRLDIIPYIVGKGNPFAKEGDLHYERTYFIHRSVGAENNSYCCTGKCFKRKCAVCDERGKMARDPEADEKLVKDLAPKERQLFNLVDLTEPEKGVQLFEYSHWLFGKALDAKIRGADDNEYDLFADLEKGLTLKVVFEEEKGAGYSFFKVADLEFKPRRAAYDEDILDKCACLDDCPIEMEYNEYRKIFLQLSEDETLDDEPDDDDDDDNEDDNEEEPAPKKPGKKPIEEEDDDEEEEESGTAEDYGIVVNSVVEHDELGTCTVTFISKDGLSLRLEDEEGEEHRGIRPDDVEFVKQKPDKKTTGKKPTGKPAKVEVNDEEEPAPKKPTKGKTKKEPAPKKPKPAPDKKKLTKKEEPEDDDPDDDDDDEEEWGDDD